MKNSGICPKCKSDCISEIESDSLGARIKTGAFSIAGSSYFVCCNCGYTEEWITDKKDLEKLATKPNRQSFSSDNLYEENNLCFALFFRLPLTILKQLPVII